MTQSKRNRWELEKFRYPGPEETDAIFAAKEAAGEDVHGEANLICKLVTTGVILDAGCGTGRVAIELAQRGFVVMGVGNDRAALALAEQKAPQLSWQYADLEDATLDLGRHFDGIVLAGDVIIFLTPGAAPEVIENMARHLAPGGWLVAGFHLGAWLDANEYDAAAQAAGLKNAQRWSTWESAPWKPGSDYVVFAHQRAAN